MRIDFEVISKPHPQGSKRQVSIRRRDGSIVQKDGRDLTRTVDDDPKLADWKQQVARAARAVHDGGLLIGPVFLGLTFYRPRRQGDFGTGRNAGKVKDSAPKYPTQQPDTLKLARAVEDALTGVVWVDDSQVVEHLLRKLWGDYFRVSVQIETLDDGASIVQRACEQTKVLFDELA